MSFVLRISLSVLVGLWMGLAGGCAGASKTSSVEKKLAQRPQLTLGVCTHFAQRKGTLNDNLAMIQNGGAVSIRDETPWAGVERQKDQLEISPHTDEYVNAALAAGLEPMLVLDYGNRFYDQGAKPTTDQSIEGFVRYARHVVSHFKGRVRMFEVWNEWDIGIGTPGGKAGTAADYIQLLKAVAPAIRAVNPDVIVIGGAVTGRGINSGFLATALEMGLARYCDIISIHPYNYSSAREADRTPEALARWVTRVDELVRQSNDGQAKPLYVTEIGWPTHQGPGGIPPARSAAYLARFLLLARTIPTVRGIWWYDFQDDGWNASDPENNFGLVRPDLTAKAGYFAWRDVSRLVADAKFTGRVSTDQDSVWILRFRNQHGRTIVAAWTTDDAARHQLVLEAAGTATPDNAIVTMVGRAPLERAWRYRDWVTSTRSPVRDNELAITLTGMPVLIDVGSADVKIQLVEGR